MQYLFDLGSFLQWLKPVSELGKVHLDFLKIVKV
jgi:hypothetical protein